MTRPPACRSSCRAAVLACAVLGCLVLRRRGRSLVGLRRRSRPLGRPARRAGRPAGDLRVGAHRHGRSQRQDVAAHAPAVPLAAQRVVYGTRRRRRALPAADRRHAGGRRRHRQPTPTSSGPPGASVSFADTSTRVGSGPPVRRPQRGRPSIQIAEFDDATGALRRQIPGPRHERADDRVSAAGHAGRGRRQHHPLLRRRRPAVPGAGGRVGLVRHGHVDRQRRRDAARQPGARARST